MKLIQKGNGVEIEAGGGVFRVCEGDKLYGAVCVDFVVKDGKGNEVAIPVATIESPTDEVRPTAATADGVSVYVFENPRGDEFTMKGVIPRKEILDVAREEGVNVA